MQVKLTSANWKLIFASLNQRNEYEALCTLRLPLHSIFFLLLSHYHYKMAKNKTTQRLYKCVNKKKADEEAEGQVAPEKH